MPRLTARPGEIQKYLVLLAETPRRFAAFSAGVTASQLAAPPAPGEWSALQILSHLRACEDNWGYSVLAMLALDQPVLTVPGERRWVSLMRGARLDFHQSLQTFTLKRAEFLAVLQALPPQAWERTARIGGKTHSVFSQVRRMAVHEQTHCGQLEALFPAGK